MNLSHLSPLSLTAEFRFEGNQIYITRDDATGDVVLSNQPGARVWDAFFELVHAVEAPDEFMVERPLNHLSQAPGVFDDEVSLHPNQER